MDILKANPNGSHEELNDYVNYEVHFQQHGYTKHYFLSVTDCTINECGGMSFTINFGDTYARLKNVNRRSKAAEQMCNDWLKANVDTLHAAYLNGGMDAVKAIATLPAEIN